MDLISSNIGNRDGEILSSNPIYSDFEQKRQTSDHGESKPSKLQTDLHAFPLRISGEDLIKDQSIFPLVVSLSLVIFSLHYVLKFTEALIFFRLLISNCLNWKIHCNDHSLLSSTTAVQI